MKFQIRSPRVLRKSLVAALYEVIQRRKEKKTSTRPMTLVNEHYYLASLSARKEKQMSYKILDHLFLKCSTRGAAPLMKVIKTYKYETIGTK